MTSTYAGDTPKPDNVWLKTLVAGPQWVTPAAGPTTIGIYVGAGETLTFDDGAQFDIRTLVPDAAERKAIALTLQLIESVCNIDFVVTHNRDKAEIVLAMTDDETAEGYLGYAYFPGDSLNPETGEDQSLIVVNHDAYPPNSPSLKPGGFDFITFIHEMGHALGLDHPHDGIPPFPGVDSPFDDFGLFDMNQGIYTMMTYNDGWNTAPHGRTPSGNFGFEGGPMALDIAALQYLYGANMNFARGADVYVLPGENKKGTFYQTIWDAGGRDTIRYDGELDCTINLRTATLNRNSGGGGFVSYADGIHGGYTIANGAVIERAVGSGGDDLVRGNRADNLLSSRGGDDRLFGGFGDDRIVGGGGADDISGGDGRDLFAYRALSASRALNTDTISDFEHRGDRIDLHAIDSNTARAGNNRFTFLAEEGAEFTRAGQVRFVHEGRMTIVEASVDGDADAELTIALAGTLNLTAIDFIL